MPSFADPELYLPDVHECPSEEIFTSTKIFPVVHAIKEDVIVSSSS